LLPSDTRKQLIRIRQQVNQIFDTVQEMAKSHGANLKINTEMVETSSASAADE
jgi:membrane-bound ClpP family serine protease